MKIGHYRIVKEDENSPFLIAQDVIFHDKGYRLMLGIRYVCADEMFYCSNESYESTDDAYKALLAHQKNQNKQM